MTMEYLQAGAALVLVLALIAGLSLAARRLGLAGAAPIGRAGRRLAIVETLALDQRTRLVLVRRDGVEHLLAVAAGGVSVIERGRADASPSRQTDPEPP